MATERPQTGPGERRLADGYRLIQTLVGIRIQSVTDPDCLRHLTWISDVAAAMQLINRRAQPDGSVDFVGYLQDAGDFWTRSAGRKNVRVEVRGSAADLPARVVLPLAVVTHELIGNALRHAFTEGARGTVAVAVSQAVDAFSLVVRDNGQGHAELAPGEGLALVRGMVEHLNGEIEIETASGAGFCVRIRLPLHGEHPGH